MTPTQEAAMRQALEALGQCVSTCFDQYAHEQVMSRPEHFVNQTITALRDALAEPVQEPVAWRFQSAVGGWAYGSQPPLGSKYPAYPLYTAPPQRKPLTDEEIRQIALDTPIGGTNFARAIERAHGIQ